MKVTAAVCSEFVPADPPTVRVTIPARSLSPAAKTCVALAVEPLGTVAVRSLPLPSVSPFETEAAPARLMALPFNVKVPGVVTLLEDGGAVRDVAVMPPAPPTVNVPPTVADPPRPRLPEMRAEPNVRLPFVSTPTIVVLPFALRLNGAAVLAVLPMVRAGTFP